MAGIKARRQCPFPDNLEFMEDSPVTLDLGQFWTLLGKISNRLDQLCLEQVKLPRGSEPEMHGNDLVEARPGKDRGYVRKALGQKG